MAARSKGCPGCGGTRTIEATDNHGNKYQGCPNCIVLLPGDEPPLRPFGVLYRLLDRAAIRKLSPEESAEAFSALVALRSPKAPSAEPAPAATPVVPHLDWKRTAKGVWRSADGLYAVAEELREEPGRGARKTYAALLKGHEERLASDVSEARARGACAVHAIEQSRRATEKKGSAT